VTSGGELFSLKILTGEILSRKLVKSMILGIEQSWGQAAARPRRK
jgi:hypothetical protein